MTAESNPHDTAPGYMPILEYWWYGSAGTWKPSGYTLIAFLRKLEKTSWYALRTRLSYPSKGVTRGTKKTSKRQKRNKNRKRIEKEQKLKKKTKKNDSDFDTRLVGSNLYIN